MVDSQKDSYEMDYDQVEEAITEKTKAIIPVDIGGVLCDYERIYEIVKKKKDVFHASNEIQKAYGRIIIVADGAHSFGAEKDGKRSGQFADFTNFSFHAVKNLTTAEGGAVTWQNHEGVDNEEIYKQYQLLSLHGQSKDALAKNQLGAWEYDIKGAYYKCNMTDIMAGIGLAQLRRYPEILKRRKEIINKYDEAFKQLNVELLDHTNSSGHLYMVRMLGKNANQRNEIIMRMAEAGIATNV
ncbi:DegT/DnrJ/EryC1/StrS family aminotransferase, partial [[Eubacterium] hominis]|uniref:DegT/DnrJ/EryC1/StrS family aminotransferase n=1 Tax=[Eubacterium] hominis TaxID=2764325 RepID=UPI003A4DB2DF